MHPRNGEAVTRDADETDEPLVAGLLGGLDRSILPQGELPLDHVDQVVQLQEVDLLDAESVERTANLLPRAAVVALPGLRGEKETIAIPGQPRRDPELRVAVGGGGVDVVHAVLEQDLERCVRLRL